MLVSKISRTLQLLQVQLGQPNINDNITPLLPFLAPLVPAVKVFSWIFSGLPAKATTEFTATIGVTCAAISTPAKSETKILQLITMSSYYIKRLEALLNAILDAYRDSDDLSFKSACLNHLHEVVQRLETPATL